MAEEVALWISRGMPTSRSPSEKKPRGLIRTADWLSAEMQLSRMKSALRIAVVSFLSGRVAKNTLYATFWQGIRVATQAIWAIMIARALGPQGYGTFAGMVGLASALGALSGLGLGLLMLQDVTRNSASFAESWKRAWVTTLVSGLLLMAGFITLAPMISGVHDSWFVFAAIGIPELICFPLIIVCSFAFQAHERMGWAGAIYVLAPAGNVVAALAFIQSQLPRTLEVYALFHSVAATLTATCAVLLVHSVLKPTSARFRLERREISEGFSFSTMRIVDTSMFSLDKTLVLRLAGSEIAGIYTSAFRLVAVLALPVTSLAMAALPRMFRDGHKGNISKGFIRLLLICAIGYGIVAGIAMWFLSGVLPILFGPAFESSAQAARWMSSAPMFMGLTTIGCNVLVTCQKLRLRVIAQGSGLLLLVGSAALWVPHFGLAGAAMMLCSTLAILAVLLWLLIWRMGKSQSVIRSMAIRNRSTSKIWERS
jgi:O-antigen/teichoic acid export membrane protein